MSKNTLRLLIAALIGVAVFIAVLLLLNVPENIITGNRAQLAIQHLDAMRSPMLSIEKLEGSLSKHSSEPASTQYAKELKKHIKDYFETAKYNDELYGYVKQFAQAIDQWFEKESVLWQYRNTLQAPETDIDSLAKIKRQHEAAIDSFLGALEILALGEHPIHQDIKSGRQANYILFALIAALVLYLLSLVVIFQRITRKALLASFHETQQAHQELVQREQYLSLTLDSIGDAVIATDASGNITRMNPIAIQLTGWSFQEARGKSLKTIFPIIDASTRESIENPVEKVIATGKTIYLSNHTTLIAKDGQEYQIADSAAPIRDSDNNITGMVLVFNDVTEQYRLRAERRESEKRLVHAQRMAQIGSWELDLINNQLQWSDEIYRIFEINAEEIETSYETFLAAVHPDDRELIDTTYKTSVANKMPYNIEHRLCMADGRIKHVHELCKTFYDDEGNPVRSTGTIQDITERVNMEEALRRSQKMDAIGQLSGGIAHDFNNQLGIVIGYLDFLSDHFPENDKTHQWVKIASKATLRCMDLTRQLLSFSRHHTKQKTTVDLNASILDMQTIITRSVTPEIEVQYSLAEDLGFAEIDPAEFQDVILNLTINARDAMPDGGTLQIETHNKYLDTTYTSLNPGVEVGDYLELVISDTGTGMDSETLEHVFEPFFTTKPRDKGTGLGMAMVYSFVKRYNGHVKLYSELDVGTTLHLFLPCSHSAVSDTDVGNNRATEFFTGSESILIVDDEEDLLQLTNQVLSDLGYRTLLAKNAAQALAILKTDNEIDLLFSDVVMPGGINGFELAKQATELKPELKVLLTSGFTSKSVNHDDLIRFSSHMLGKPYRKSDLAQRIRVVLDAG